MDVFISWSGHRSGMVAKALVELLPDAIQELKAWMSEHDIGAGARWGHELHQQLESSNFGILCLTRDNISAPWLLYEAGSLAKSVSDARVVPYRLDLAATDVPFPLAQFQGVDADEDGTRKLIESLNAGLKRPMDPARLNRIFERWWPDFQQKINTLPLNEESGIPKRSDRELLEEVLGVVRDIAHSAPRIVANEAFLSQINRELKGLYEQEYRMEFVLRDKADENPDYQDLERYIDIHTRLLSVLDELVKFKGYPKSKRNDYA